MAADLKDFTSAILNKCNKEYKKKLPEHFAWAASFFLPDEDFLPVTDIQASIRLSRAATLQVVEGCVS